MWTCGGWPVMEVLSEHLCEGWLEGYYLRTPRTFLLLRSIIISSIRVQPAREMAACAWYPWRRPIASAQLLADVARLARITTGFPIRSRLH